MILATIIVLWRRIDRDQGLNELRKILFSLRRVKSIIRAAERR